MTKKLLLAVAVGAAVLLCAALLSHRSDTPPWMWSPGNWYTDPRETINHPDNV